MSDRLHLHHGENVHEAAQLLIREVKQLLLQTREMRVERCDRLRIALRQQIQLSQRSICRPRIGFVRDLRAELIDDGVTIELVAEAAEGS